MSRGRHPRLLRNRPPEHRVELRAAGLVVVDIDPRSGGEAWREARAEEHGEKWLDTVTSRTGGGGVHLFYQAPADEPIRNSSGKLAPGVDIKSERGAVVLPPSRHTSREYYEWEDGLSPWDREPAPLPRWLLDDIRRPSKPEKPARSTGQSCSSLSVIPVGRRNETLFGVARKLTGAGFGEQVLEIISAVNKANTEEPLPDTEVQRLVESARSHAAPTPTEMSFFTVADLKDLPSREWLIEGFLQANSVAMLTGVPGAGKSFVATSVALSVATGTDWLGRPVKQGPVVYFALEGFPGYSARTAAWLEHHALAEEDTGALRFANSSPILTQPAAATSILAALEKEGLSPALIIIDTLARSIAGSDENSAGDMGQLVRTLDEVRRVTDATVLLIHHPPKNGSAAYRGSSVLMGSVDTAVSLDQKAGLLTITCEKQKDGTSFSAIPARLHPVGHSCALVEGDFADVAEELPLTRASVARHLVRLYIATGRPVRFSELRAVASKSTVDRALKQLKENQQVVKDEDGRYIPSDALIAKYREETTPSLVA